MRIPLFPLDMVLLPGAPMPLHIFEDRYKEMIGECVGRRSEFGIVRARRDGMAVVGCTAEIVSVTKQYPDGRMDILCCGTNRFEIESLHDGRSFPQAEVDMLQDDGPGSTRMQREQCAALHMEMIELSGDDARSFPPLDLNQPVAFLLASRIPAGLEFKQGMLHLRSDASRTERLIAFYDDLLPKLRLGAMGAMALGGHVM